MIDYNYLKYQSRDKIFEIAMNLYNSKELDDAVRAIGLIVDDYPNDYEALYLYGAILQDGDKNGLAEVMFRRCVELDPSRADGWIGIATSIRSPERSDEAISCFIEALLINPKSRPAMCNLACCYNEIGEYELAEKYAKEALRLGGGLASHDTYGTALLGQEKFEEGFKETEWSLGAKYRKEYIYGDEERWDGTKGKSVIVFGEQGIGDEIFYGTCIPDAIKDCKKVIIDCDPRLEGLFRRSFPKASVYGTRNRGADWLKNHKWDYRSAMASLPQYYRKTLEDFPGTPFLKPCPVRTHQWASTLKGMNIGIAWNGGSRFTNHKFRRIPLVAFAPLYKMGTCISLEYEKKDTKGYPIKWYEFATLTKDYDDTAALVANLDFVVTTCTAIVHLAGGLGVPCYVLKAPYTSWRYAHSMPWYNSVTLIDWKGSWEAGMDEVVKLIEEKKAA